MEIAPNSRTQARASIVIASLVGAPFIDDCLNSLEAQAREFGAETIVVACGEAEYAERIARKFPWVRVAHRPDRESVPALRRHGVGLAAGEYIAIIEEHCLAAPNWLARGIEAHESGSYGAVGGPVAHREYQRIRDWVVYFCEYNAYMPPWQDGETTHLGSANIVYSREVLIRYKSLLGDGYWEAGLHGRLIADGIRFRSAPEMVVYHRGPFDYRYYLGQRFWFSRAFSSARQLTRGQRLLYLAASPLIPFLLLGRIGRRVVQQRCRMGKFLQSLPLLAPVLAVYVAGEAVGYLAGPGDALLRVE